MSARRDRGARADDARFMALAIGLGGRGLGRVWPNPAVGCVLVRDGQIIGRGWTQPGGRPHAEPQALAQAQALFGGAHGATAYVSLEPCAHHGQTPPCAGALIAAGVARVVTALKDPDPRVAGGGHAMLRAAGIAVETGLLADQARAQQRGFLARILQGRPMLSLKLASSFDGRIATAAGESRWITAAPARHWVHGARARHDATLVGGGTLRADDPLLTVRGLGDLAQPLRLVASAGLDLPIGRFAASITPQAPVWLLHGPAADPARRAQWQGLGARLIAVPLAAQGRGLDARALMQALGQAGLTRVFCEGGGQFAASLLQADQVDEILGFTAGLALGSGGLPSLGALNYPALAAAPRFDLVESRAIGPDILHRWQRPIPAHWLGATGGGTGFGAMASGGESGPESGGRGCCQP